MLEAISFSTCYEPGYRYHIKSYFHNLCLKNPKSQEPKTLSLLQQQQKTALEPKTTFTIS
jgi:hypothetical protein